MSQNSQKIRHLSNCSVAASAQESAVVIAASCDVSARKKDEARKVLYLTRI